RGGNGAGRCTLRRSQPPCEPCEVRPRERSRLHLVTVLAITAAAALGDVPPRGQRAALPLPQDVAILVQYELRIREERLGAAAQIDTATPGGRDRSQVQPCKPGTLDHPNVADALTEHGFERS